MQFLDNSVLENKKFTWLILLVLLALASSKVRLAFTTIALEIFSTEYYAINEKIQ